MTAAFVPPQGYPDQFVACHQAPHWMETIPANGAKRPPARCVNVWWRCNRCGTERHDVCEVATLAVVSRRYLYPVGYRVSRDEMPDRRTWKATYLELQGVLSQNQARAARKYRREMWEASQ